jgi:PAS domain S-box-containing protein
MNSETFPTNQHNSGRGMHDDLLNKLNQAETEKRELQSELTGLKERFGYVLKATQDAVWDWDLINNAAWYSEGLETIFGYNYKTIHDGVKFWYDTIHPDDRERVLNGIHSVIDNGGNNWHDRYRFRKSNGTYAWVFDRGYAIHNQEGKPIRMVGSIQDVTKEVEAREALRESEEKFRGAFNQVAVGISISSPGGEFLSINQAYPKIFGYTEEELKQKRISDLSHPGELEGDRMILNELLSGRSQTVAREKRYLHKDGSIVWGRVFGTVVWDEHKNPKYIVGVLEDITNERQVLDALRDSEERLRLVIDSAEIGTWDFNPRSGVLFWDARCKAMFGMLPEDEATYEIFLTGVHPDEREIVDKINKDAIAGVNNGEYDLEYRTIGLRDKKLRWVRAKGRGYKDENGQPVRYAGTVVDITEAKLQEQRLREQEQRFRLLATSIPQIVWTADEEGIVDYMSDKWQAYTGHVPTYEKFSFRELMHPEDLQHVIPEWSECMRKAVTYNGEYRLKNLNTGEYRWYSCTTAPLFNEHGKVVKWIGSATDIHQQKATEMELENKVIERTKELTDLNAQLERSNSELEQYAYVTSHDLKEPLRKIRTYNDLIASKFSGDVSKEILGFMSKIESSASRMTGLIDDLLKYSKLSHSVTLAEPVDISSTITNIRMEFEYILQERNIVIEVTPLPTITAVPFQIHQLFFNLFSNAIKFSKRESPNVIRISSSVLSDEERNTQPELTKPGRHFKIVFKDEGIGFSEKYGEQIFTIFNRLNSRAEYEGHGIGLALCRKIVNNHHGLIWAKGQQGHGASFTIILPESQ